MTTHAVALNPVIAAGEGVNMETTTTRAPRDASQISTADAFRAWLGAALPAVGMSRREAAEAVGLGPTTVQAFLADPARDIRMGTAAALHGLITAKAHGAGIALPELRAVPRNG